MRHDGVICRVAIVWSWVASRHRGQTGRGGRRGLAVRPQIGAQRHYRPPHKAWFIHKYQRIAISQRCHHFPVEATPKASPAPASPFTTPLYSSKQYDNPKPSSIPLFSIHLLLAANMAVEATCNSHARDDRTQIRVGKRWLKKRIAR